MSKGALKELIRSDPKKFTRLTKDIPHSERKEIINYFVFRVIILQEFL